jgi:hypothetical protein
VKGRSIRKAGESERSRSSRRAGQSGEFHSRRLALAILAVATLLAIEVARLTVASAFAETDPAFSERFAPRLPDVLVSSAMAEVGQAAAQGRLPPESTRGRLRHLATSAPLAPEPLLVHGAIALKEGQTKRAERLLVEARRLSPRSAAARFLLADVWLNQGRIEDGLGEMAALSLLIPGSSVQLAPALAQYARTPDAGPELKRMVASNPQLKAPLLAALAADPDNLPLILEIDEGGLAKKGEPPPWQTIVLNRLTATGNYGRAYNLWKQFAGFGGPRPLLFNGDFRKLSAPPPFNWELKSGNAGFAEPANGRLRVLHYGRADALLASQMLLLPPGKYRLRVGVSGSAGGGSLHWILLCQPQKQRLMQLQLAQPGLAEAGFEVPGDGCAAQRLELRGLPLDMPKEADALVGPVVLQRSGP